MAPPKKETLWMTRTLVDKCLIQCHIYGCPDSYIVQMFAGGLALHMKIKLVMQNKGNQYTQFLRFEHAFPFSKALHDIPCQLGYCNRRLLWRRIRLLKISQT